jgi:hypothetical protein
MDGGSPLRECFAAGRNPVKSESDPREIGYAFHGAGEEFGEKKTFFKGLLVGVGGQRVCKIRHLGA